MTNKIYKEGKMIPVPVFVLAVVGFFTIFFTILFWRELFGKGKEEEPSVPFEQVFRPICWNGFNKKGPKRFVPLGE